MTGSPVGRAAGPRAGRGRGGVAALRRLPSWTVPLLLAVLVLLAPALGLDLNAQRQVVLIAILALLVSGLNLSLGFAGELALGGAAVYAVGAYVSGYLAMHGHTDILLQLVVSGVLALVVGVLTGVPGLRLGQWSLAMTSFFLILVVPDVITLLPNQTGGQIGLAGIPFPTLFGRTLGQRDYYLIVVAVTALWLLFLRNLVTSRHGTALRVLRQSPVLAASSGISVRRLKLTAYALGAVPAGFAGTLFANLDHYVSPGTFDFTLVVTILAASILGGSASVYGAVVGAAVMQLGPLQSSDFDKYQLLVFGAFLVVGGVLLGGGVTGLVRRGLDRLATRAGRPAAESVAGGVSGELDAIPGARLEITGVGKRFGGLQVLTDVSLHAEPGRITAVIGPNGSGKTTLLNTVCGFYRPDTGTITVDGSSPARRTPHAVARSGVARTFQTPLVPRELTVLETVVAGRWSVTRAGMPSAVLRLPRARRARRDDALAGRRALAALGIEAQADDDATSLPLGTRRLLEVARALVAEPRVLLLDEPASGLDEHEVEVLAHLLRRLRDAGATVVLVEHNFGLVLSLADRIHVLAQGQVIAEGPPEQIERNPRVLAEYLGMTDPSEAAVETVVSE